MEQYYRAPVVFTILGSFERPQSTSVSAVSSVPMPAQASWMLTASIWATVLRAWSSVVVSSPSPAEGFEGM